MSLMGVDLGTTGVKAVCFDPTGRILATAYREYPIHIPHPGWMELDAELVWRDTAEAIAESSSKCKDPVTAIKWIDYVYASPEGIAYTNFGIEGQTYTVQGGTKKYTDLVLKNPDGLVLNDVLRKFGATPTVAWIQTVEMYEAQMSPDVVAMAQKVRPLMDSPFPPILRTAEESDQWAKITNDLDTYKWEMISKFFLGTESLDNFDAYVKKLKDLGLDQLIAIKQAGYDRFLNAKTKK